MYRLFIATTYLVGTFFLLTFLSFVFSISPQKLVKEFFSQEGLFALKFTLVTALIATFITLPLAVILGYSLARFQFPFKKLLKVTVDLPMAFPELLTGFLLLIMFSGLLKPLTAIFNPVFSPSGVVLAEIAVSLPFASRIVYTTFKQIDKRYEMVARSLGYSFAETFLKVSLPMAKGGLISATVVTFARSFGAFGAVLILGGGVYMKTETLPVGIFLNISYGNLDRAVAMGVVLMAVSFITVWLIELFQKEGEDSRF